MLHIITPYGEHYKVDARGRIARQHWDKPDVFLPPSEKWTMRGLQHVKNNAYIPFTQLTPEHLKTLVLLYKNGHPQWTVADMNHGTRRTWGNTHFHGIKHLYFE